MIETENDLVCCINHNQPIQQVLINHQIPVSQRLLCASCISELESQFISISFQQAKNKIQQKQEIISRNLIDQVNCIQDKLCQFKQDVDTLKFNIIQKFDSLISYSEEWTNDLSEFLKSKIQYNLLDEIEHLGESIEQQEEKIIFKLNELNYSYFKKFQNIYEIDQLFKNIVDTKEAIDKLYNNLQFYQMPKQKIKIKEYNKNVIFIFIQATPYLPLNCKNHSKEIIQVDLRKGIKQEDRLKCVYCKNEKSVTVVQFAELWDQYYNGRKQRINKKQEEQQKSLDELKESLYRFIVDLAKIIGDAVLSLERKIYPQQLNNDSLQLIKMAELLSQDENILDKENRQLFKEGFKQLDSLTQYLNKAFETFQFKQQAQTKDLQLDISQINTFSQITQYMVVDSIQEDCRAITFNNDGSIMAAACYKDIKIWKFEDGKLEKTLANLQGHTSFVLCLVYSKKRNWIASAGCDCTIRLWKDMGNNQWNSSQTRKVHTHYIYCLLMNQREDQLISGSADSSIKIWSINFETNSLNYEYSLDKHQKQVFSISLNESESTLVSCGADKLILIWGKQENQRWEYKYSIYKSVDDFGYRVCFINDQMIAWQQASQGYTHLYKLKKGMFIEKPELNLELNSEISEGSSQFPSVYNQQNQLLIQKHNKQQQDGSFKIACEPIDCQSQRNFGGITDDGKFLAIWNDSTKEIRVHRINE